MNSEAKGKWWAAGVGWTAVAVLLAMLAGGLVPAAAQTTGTPLLQAMALHAHLVYAIAGLMTTMGWIDSLLLYRRRAHDTTS